VVDFDADPLFSYTFWLCSGDFIIQNRFYAKAQSAPRSQSGTTPCPSSFEEGSPGFPSLDKEGLGVVESLAEP